MANAVTLVLKSNCGGHKNKKFYWVREKKAALFLTYPFLFSRMLQQAQTLYFFTANLPVMASAEKFNCRRPCTKPVQVSTIFIFHAYELLVHAAVTTAFQYVPHFSKVIPKYSRNI